MALCELESAVALKTHADESANDLTIASHDWLESSWVRPCGHIGLLVTDGGSSDIAMTV